VGLDIAERAIDFLHRSWDFSGHVATVGEFHRRHPDRRFDLVVSSHSLEHSLEPRRALESMAALLDRDGILFLTLPNHDSYSRAQMGGYAPAIRGGNHYQFFSVRRLRTALEEVGLRITETFTSSAHSPHLQTLTSLLARDRIGCTFDQIDESGEGEFIYFICAK
jgi:2-polyprenyl-3-methyl-5-hydroxy-6-metoxy-1,4-benzoquinol methylase